MKFLTPSEKLKSTRKYLKMKQEDLTDTDITRGLISMIEIGKREITNNVAAKLVKKFNKKAKELDIKFEIDESFLLRSPAEDAELYCLKKLENSNVDEDIEEVLEIASKFNLLKVRAISRSKRGDSFFMKREYDSAFINYNDSIAIYKDIRENGIIPSLYWKIGLCKIKSLQYKEALSYFDICERYSTIYKDIKTRRLALYDMALCYKKINKFDLALESIEKYLSYSNKEDDFYFYANILKANCYEAIEDYDTAIKIYNCLLTEISNTKDPLLGYIYNNLGLVYSDKDDFKASLEYFEMAEKIKNDVDKQNLCHTLIEKSEVFFKQKLYTEAIKTIRLGLKDAEIYKDYEYLLKGNYNLIRVYESMKDIPNLKETYLTIVDLLKADNNVNELVSIYVKLSIVYLDENDIEGAKECLTLSQNLYV